MFYAVDAWAGLKPAIAASAAFSIAEVAFRLWRREPVTLLFKVTAGTTVGFGLLDLAFANPRFFSYEASVSNLAFGLWMAWLMVKGPGPILDEMIKQNADLAAEAARAGGLRRLDHHLRAALAILVAWHALTAVAYLWIAARYTVEQAVGIRAIFGNVSLVLIFASVWLGTGPLHDLAERRGYFPREG